MKIRRINLPLSELKKALSEEELLAFIYFSRVLNEIWILRSLAFLTSKPHHNELERHTRTAQKQFFLSILIGKLNEAWNLIDPDSQKVPLKCRDLFKKFNEDCENGRMSQYLTDFRQEAQNSFKELKKYFVPGNDIRKIRNNDAFHYGGFKKIVGVLKNLSNENFQIEWFESGIHGNYVYPGINDLFFRSLLELVEPTKQSLSDKIARVVKDVADLSHHFCIFLSFYLSYLSEKGPRGDNYELTEMEVEGVKPTEAFIPYFFEIDSGAE